MARETLDGGIWLDFDDQIFGVRAAPAPAGAQRRGARFSEKPVPLRPVAAASGTPDPGAARALADRLVARGVVARASTTVAIGAGARAPADRRRAAAPSQPTQLTVPLAAGEQAVVLVEGDGVLAWRFGRESAPSALAAVRRSRAGATRALVFDLGIPPVSAAAPGSAQRGWIRDRLVAGVKAIVLYFAAEAVVAGAMRALEGGKRDGPVVINSATDPAAWLRPDDLAGLDLPGNRPARLLLWVHGTFSSTVGGFGELTVTPWGQGLLTAALGRYDAVIGFDHRTMSRDPAQNAGDLLDALATLSRHQPIEIDAVCHSRGGLVLRSLIEQLLPRSGLAIRVRRAVFVAATNRGTELARPDNWETLVDLVTNLSAITSQVLSLFPAAAAAATIGDEIIDTIGDFVKYLVEVAVKERRAPGIAAMDPAGAFVAEINRTQAGQPLPSDIDCYAIVSDFYAKLLDSGEHEPREMPKRLAFILADGVIDRLMRGAGAQPVPNDLVVDVASMSQIDTAVGGYVKDVLDFGHNPLVYHTNYFLRPETVGRVAQWLRLPSPVTGIDALRLAGGVQQGLRPVLADATVAQVRAIIQSEAPEFLVFAREHPTAAPRRMLQYAVRPQEFLDFTRRASPKAAAVNALDLREDGRSRPVEAQQVPFDRGLAAPAVAQKRGPGAANALRPHAQRSVVLSGEHATAVLDSGSNALDTAALAALAHELALAADDQDLLAPPAPAPERELRPPPAAIERSHGPSDDRARAVGSALGRNTLGRGGAVGPVAKRAAPQRSAPRELPREAAREAPRIGRRRSAQPAAAPTQTFATAEMPREVRLGQPALLSVTLSVEQIKAAAGMASDQGSFTASGPITVHVAPRRGFTYEADDHTAYQVVVEPPEPRQPRLLDFTLIANEVGAGEVTVMLRQGAVRLLTLTLRATVVAARAKPALGTAASSGVAAPGPDCGRCATLEIIDQRNAGELQFLYCLRAGDVDDRFRSESLKSDPRTYVERRYQAIEDAWTGSKRAVDRFAMNLEATGGEMFKQLFPPALQKTLWRLLQAGQLLDILVYSDEPFLPWEIVFIDDPDAPASTGQGRFFGDLGLCRWLHGTLPTCHIQVRPGQVRHVVPHYEGEDRLAAAEEIEQPMLEAELGAKPLQPSHAEVLQALRTPGSFDLLHFACHGQADSNEIDGAALLLQGELVHAAEGDMLAPEMLLSSTVAQFANLRGADGNRPLVVVNACQTGRVGYALTRLGGFAPAFLGAREGTGDSRGRAGAFVGALWSVGDLAASSFVAELYQGLKAGKTMSQAVRAGRAAARKAGEGTWLAYAVYAHPHLRVSFT